MGAPENFDIMQMGGPKNFAILCMGGFVRPPRMIVYDENSVGEWSQNFAILGVGGPKKMRSSGWVVPKRRVQTPPLLSF